MIKVSVILPVYNVEPYLEATFESLLGQSLRDIEIIVVNDGSTDGCAAIIGRYAAADPRIKCITQDNRGLSAARNRGMEDVSGEFVYFMDADDVIEPDTLELSYSRAVRDSADICLFDASTMLEPEATPLSWNYCQTRLLEEGRLYDGAGLLNLMMDNHRYNSVVWLYLIRTSFLVSTGLRFYEGIIHEDQLFTTALFLRTDSICCIKRTFVRHRVRGGSIMGRRFSRRNLDCYMTVMDELRKLRPNATIDRYIRFTLPLIFYTGHVLPLREKLPVFWRAVKSGYVPAIGLRSLAVFWLKR